MPDRSHPRRRWARLARWASLAAVASALALGLPAPPVAHAGHVIAVPPVHATTGDPPPLIEAFMADAVQRAGHTALSGEALCQRLGPGFDSARCRSGQCLADAVRRAGADEGIALEVAADASAIVLSLRRIRAEGRVIDQRNVSITGSVVAVLDAARAVVGASLGEIAPQGATAEPHMISIY